MEGSAPATVVGPPLPATAASPVTVAPGPPAPSGAVTANRAPAAVAPPLPAPAPPPPATEPALSEQPPRSRPDRPDRPSAAGSRPASGAKVTETTSGRRWRLDAGNLVRRLVQLGGLAVILYAVAYAILPFSVGVQTCKPAVIQVLDRGPVVAGTRLTPPCTSEAENRLYVAGPIVVLDLIALAGLRRVLS